MRKWNGWGDEQIRLALPEPALAFLREQLGAGTPPRDARLEEIAVPESRLPPHPLVHTDPFLRIRYSRGGSFPDLVALRHGRLSPVPDGVAFPGDEEAVASLLQDARRAGIQIIPRGGGTSVVGGVNPVPDGRPVLVMSLERLQGLRSLDEQSHLAVFGAGTFGPEIESSLHQHGFTLGHFPQSFEYSTVGGWVMTRSSGQQSLGYGRIEDLFAGGRLITPQGRWELPAFPASAAGPDLRQLVLGSEGRFGILTEVTMRVRPLPEVEDFWGILMPGWHEGLEAARLIAQQRVPLSMLRLSDATETRVSLFLGIPERYQRYLSRVLQRLHWQRCLMILAASGDASTVRLARRLSKQIVHRYGGRVIGRLLGRAWQQHRFRTPYLRDALWEAGYGVETLETATTWRCVAETADQIRQALVQALLGEGERVVVLVHVSHLYPDGASLYYTVLFRQGGDAEQTLARWRQIKGAASRVILSCGATISHHHGVGIDHKPYLAAEKGDLGLGVLAAVRSRLDPESLLNPGKLLPEA